MAGRGDGLLHVFAPHATAGIAIIETGSGSDRDLLTALDDVLPADDRWRHRHGSPGHGRDHVLPAFVAPVRHPARARRPDRAGHVAVDLPRRPQRRQPDPSGPPLLPPRLTRAPRPPCRANAARLPRIVPLESRPGDDRCGGDGPIFRPASVGGVPRATGRVSLWARSCCLGWSRSLAGWLSRYGRSCPIASQEGRSA